MAQHGSSSAPTPRSWLAELDRFDVLIMLAALLLLATWAEYWHFLLPLAAAGAVLAWGLALRRGVFLVGPLFWFELVHLARRGRATWLRCAYALLLLGGLAFVYVEWFGGQAALFGSGRTIDPNDLSRLGSRFLEVLLLIQSAAVVILTPMYFLGVFTAESDRHTLDLLLTTHLSDREIVLGKLLGRLADLGGVQLAGLPILCVIVLWGGIEARVLAALFAVTGMQLLSVGALAIYCAVHYRRIAQTFGSAYFRLYVLFFVSLMSPWPHVSAPFFFEVELDARLASSSISLWRPGGFSTRVVLPGPGPDLTPLLIQMTGEAAIFHGVIAFILTRQAARRLRTVAEDRPTTRVPESPNPPGWPSRAAVGPAVPAADDQPLLWKEIHHGTPPAGRLSQEGVWVLCGIVSLYLLIFSLVGVNEIITRLRLEEVRFLLNVVSRCAFIFVAGLWCGFTAFWAAGSVSQERERNTLDGLLTLPVPREAIVGAKWRGSVQRLGGLVWPLGIIWVYGVVTMSVHPLAAALLLAALAVHLAFLASFGVWLSCVCRRVLWANVGMAVALLVLVIGSWALLAAVGSPLSVGINPLRGWWFLGFSWQEFTDAWHGRGRDFWDRLAIALGGLAFYAGAAWVFWRAACRRLQRE